MVNDGSLASLVEVWIRDTLGALAAFPDENVKVYGGSRDTLGKKLVEEMTANRSPHVAILFEGDTPVTLEEGEQAYEPIYGIYVVIQNHRPGTSRTGDGTSIGTNGAREVIRTALHDQQPGIGANGFFTDQTVFRSARVIFERADVFMLRCELMVRESPLA